MRRSENTSSNAWHLEGPLFLPDQLTSIFEGKSDYQSEADYNILPFQNIKDEFWRSFNIARGLWSLFQKAQKNQKSDPSSKKATIFFVQELLKRVLDYDKGSCSDERIGDYTYPNVYRAGGLPLVIAPISQEIDKAERDFAVEGGSSVKKSPFQLAQEFLNASEADEWGLVTNGAHIRLLKDATSLTKPAYIDFDIKHILENGDYAEFIHFWRLLHSTRASEKDGEIVWKHWVKKGEEEGQRIREQLGVGVKKALIVLGTGFLQAKANDDLRNAIKNGDLSDSAFFSELLRLLYRFIFIFCLEERDLLCLTGDEFEKAREHYRKGYALRNYRYRCLRNRFYNTYNDAWESVKIVFEGLSEGQEKIALPALGGLFKTEQCENFRNCELENRNFYEAMKYLRWAEGDNQRFLVDYKNMGTEELGGVYESLLELIPNIDLETRHFGFLSESNVGNVRKSTGSYYTPENLVHELIESALDPVIEEKLNSRGDPEELLLDIKVIDPTCGSGHFLLSAARKIAFRLAEIRNGNQAVTPEGFRNALRDVTRNCLFGVDKNPLAIELAKMSLWLEGYEENRPLSFLDSHLKVGDSLVGVFDINILKMGIANDAYKVKELDDPIICKELRLSNAKARSDLIENLNSNQQLLDFSPKTLYKEIEDVESMGEETLEDVARKEKAWNEVESKSDEDPLESVCNLYMAAYLTLKDKGTKALVPTSRSIMAGLLDEYQIVSNWDDQIEFAKSVCKDYQVFHWPVEFPQIFKKGGFDCVLGNPPWEKARMEDVKWFSSRYPEIGDKDLTASERKKRISLLKKGELASYLLGKNKTELNGIDADTADAEKALFKEYEIATSKMKAASIFCHVGSKDGGRYPLTGYGDTNLYAYCAELSLNLCKENGRVGIVIPTGIVTEDATKLFCRTIFNNQLVSLYDIENRQRYFKIDIRYRYSLVTLGKSPKANCAFYINSLKDIENEDRQIELKSSDLDLINPNTNTCPILRSKTDWEITEKIYKKHEILRRKGNTNFWKIRFLQLFHMSGDSDLFKKDKADDNVPLYEGKLIHQYDNRFASFETSKSTGKVTDTIVPNVEKTDPAFEINPRYWISRKDVDERFLDPRTHERFWSNPWMLAFRDICSPTNERTFIMTVLPSSVGCGHTINVMLPYVADIDAALLLSNCNSLVFDYLLRLKQSGMHASQFFVEQIPVINSYSQKQKEFIVNRVAQLTRNSKQIRRVWLTEYPNYEWQSDLERLKLRCELDAYFAMLYGLDRSDLEFILDPKEALGPDYPSLTFPTLKINEIKKYNEYITRRLVLEAWDKINYGGLIT